MTDLLSWLREQPRPVCNVDGCDRSGKITRGMCAKHYRYWLNHTPPSERGPAPMFARRFEDYVDRKGPDDCWEWQGPRSAERGYGCWGRRRAHRHAWEMANGPVPDGLWVLHHCDNKPCVNPAHLYAGSRADNMRDAVERGRMHSPRRTHCPHGHLKDGDNLITVRHRGYVLHRCRTCELARKRENARRRYARMKEAARGSA